MTRPTRALLLVAALVAVAALATPGAAVSASATQSPNATQVGENVTASYVLTDLYTDAPTEWRLNATTGLDNATWTVTAAGLDHRVLATRQGRGPSITVPVRAARNVSEVTVSVTGTAPSVANFTYPARERYRLVSFAREGGNSSGTIDDWRAAHYTRSSQSARTTLNASRAAIRDNGSDAELEEQFGFAVTAYRAGEFDLATSIAADARQDAGRANYPIGMISGLFLGGIVVVLGGAGVRTYRKRSEADSWRDR